MSDPHKIKPEIMDLPPPYPLDFRPTSGLARPSSMEGFTTPIVDFTEQMPEGRLVINASSQGMIENSAGVESVQGTSGLNGMELKQEAATQFRLYSKRWFMLLIYGIDVSIGNMYSIAFASVADIVGEYLGTEVSSVNWFNTMSNAVLLPPIGPIAAHFADTPPTPIHFLLGRRLPVTRLLHFMWRNYYRFISRKCVSVFEIFMCFQIQKMN